MFIITSALPDLKIPCLKIIFKLIKNLHMFMIFRTLEQCACNNGKATSEEFNRYRKFPMENNLLKI